LRYAPAPERVDLTNVSREVVMDRHPWTYTLTAVEMRREGKIADAAVPNSGQIPDLRRFAFVGACGEVGTAAVAFAVKVGEQWISSDRGVPQFRIVRDGCFRAAIALPQNAGPRDIRAIRVIAHQRTPSDGTPAPAPTPVRLTRINTLFMLDARYEPAPSLFHWEGSATITAAGPPLELPIR
jgi:hypothetical protein